MITPQTQRPPVTQESLLADLDRLGVLIDQVRDERDTLRLLVRVAIALLDGASPDHEDAAMEVDLRDWLKSAKAALPAEGA
jgi:hypothetical protein